MEESKYAGFWVRFAAALIDGVILVIGTSLISLIIISIWGPITKSFSNILGIFSTWLYFALMESSNKRATLGKMALAINVTDLNGYKLSFGLATGRHFCKFISTLILYIGFIMAGFTRQKQALHDKLTGCLVINNKSSQNENF